MLNISDQAGEYLTQILVEADVKDDACVRIASRGGNLQLVLDRPSPDDESFEHEGRTVLVLDRSLAEALDDRTLEVVEQSGETKLSLS